MKDLTSYTPQRTEIAIAKQYDKLPQTLFDGAESLEQVQKILHVEFVTTNEPIKVFRKLDSYEVSTIRSNYSELLEDKLPVVKDEYATIQENAKKAIQDAKDRYTSCETQIQDLVYQVKNGKKEIELDQNSCYRIPAVGHYLYFSWINEEFTLVNVEKIPEWDADKIFSQGEQNVEAFKRILGIDIVSLLDERKAVKLAQGNDQDQDPQ